MMKFCESEPHKKVSQGRTIIVGGVRALASCLSWKYKSDGVIRQERKGQGSHAQRKYENDFLDDEGENMKMKMIGLKIIN